VGVSSWMFSYSPQDSIGTRRDTMVTSGEFKIKPYILTRLTSDGQYEDFIGSEDGQSFANVDTIMWPESWWGGDPPRFDYINGIDPYSPAYWKSWANQWVGSCTGFAVSSLMAFDDTTRFREIFPMGDFQNLRELSID